VPIPIALRQPGIFSVTNCLILICVIAFLLDQVFIARITQGGTVVAQVPVLRTLGSFSINRAILHGQVWRFLTFQFLHGSWPHLALNMVGLYFFGRVIESVLGARRFLAFYLLCGVAGAVGYMVLWGWENSTGIELLRAARLPLIGASAGVYGVVVATARLAPRTTVYVMGVLPAQLRDLALLMLAIAVFTAWTSGPNAGGEAAHLGGAVLGWLLIPRMLRRRIAVAPMPPPEQPA
jgi:membrane associated rhomboid family serine protease